MNFEKMGDQNEEFLEMQKDAQERAERVLESEKEKDIKKLHEMAQAPDDLGDEFEEMSRRTQEIGENLEEEAA